MTAPRNDEPGNDGLAQNVKVRADRRRRFESEPDASLGRRLAQIGVLGWIVVAPMLVAMFAGRYLDQSFSSGIFWTAALLVAGLAIGCWAAWRWVREQ